VAKYFIIFEETAMDIRDNLDTLNSTSHNWNYVILYYGRNGA